MVRKSLQRSPTFCPGRTLLSSIPLREKAWGFFPEKSTVCTLHYNTILCFFKEEPLCFAKKSSFFLSGRALCFSAKSCVTFEGRVLCFAKREPCIPLWNSFVLVKESTLFFTERAICFKNNR
jgi:hypothetical protein